MGLTLHKKFLLNYLCIGIPLPLPLSLTESMKMFGALGPSSLGSLGPGLGYSSLVSLGSGLGSGLESDM